MKIIWLGQGGLLFISDKRKILVDPYLTNSLKKVDRSLARRVKINKKLFKIKPDIIVLTNSHPDHTDIKTLEHFLGKKSKTPTTVLSCESSFKLLVEEKGCNKANHIMFEEGSEWTLDNLHIRAIKAKTDDRSAFGFILTDSTDGKTYYVASNTLYNKYVLEEIPEDLYAAFVPINGMYGCMNMTDAIRFARKVNAEFTIPIHYGMFDKTNPNDFVVPGRVVPNPNRVIEFNILPIQSLFAPKVLDRKFNEKKPKKSKKDSEFEDSNEEYTPVDKDLSNNSGSNTQAPNSTPAPVPEQQSAPQPESKVEESKESYKTQEQANTFSAQEGPEKSQRAEEPTPVMEAYQSTVPQGEKRGSFILTVEPESSPQSHYDSSYNSYDEPPSFSDNQANSYSEGYLDSDNANSYTDNYTDESGYTDNSYTNESDYTDESSYTNESDYTDDGYTENDSYADESSYADYSNSENEKENDFESDFSTPLDDSYENESSYDEDNINDILNDPSATLDPYYTDDEMENDNQGESSQEKEDNAKIDAFLAELEKRDKGEDTDEFYKIN